MKSAMDIVCPVCNVAPGIDCLPAGRTHQERFDAAERANHLVGAIRDFRRAFGVSDTEKPKGPAS